MSMWSTASGDYGMTSMEADREPAPALVCPGCGSPDVDLRHGLLCRTCAATVAEEAGDGH